MIEPDCRHAGVAGGQSRARWHRGQARHGVRRERRSAWNHGVASGAGSIPRRPHVGYWPQTLEPVVQT